MSVWKKKKIGLGRTLNLKVKSSCDLLCEFEQIIPLLEICYIAEAVKCSPFHFKAGTQRQDEVLWKITLSSFAKFWFLEIITAEINHCVQTSFTPSSHPLSLYSSSQQYISDYSKRTKRLKSLFNLKIYSQGVRSKNLVHFP